MTDDLQLLRRYAADGAEEAFRELVGRHVDLVYSTALRSLAGDASRAEDVTQAVFTDLARKADSLPTDVVVAGWLYRAARFAAAKAARTEQRRRTRESAAMEAHMEPAEPEPDWDQIRPLLDAAMDELPATDRDAVVLRYFQRRDLRDMGAMLGLSDDAARKRVGRALDRLRDLLSRRGITTTTGALAAVISAHAVAAAPTGLASAVTAAALATGAASVGTAFALKLLPTVAMTKTQTALLTAALAAGLATPLVIRQHHEAARLKTAVEMLQAQVAELSARPSPPTATAESPGNAQLSADKVELMRLRGEVARLRAEAAEVAKAAAPRTRPSLKAKGRFKPNTPLSTQPGYVPAGQSQFVGFTTPEDALQSFLWASANPASGKLLSTLALPDEVKKHLPEDGQNVAIGLGLPQMIKDSETPTVDVISQQSTDQPPSPTAGYRIAAETDLGPDSKQVEVERELPDGTVVSATHTLKKTDDGWKVEPGFGMQLSFSAGDGKTMFFNSAPSTGNDGSQGISQTVEIHASGSDAVLPKP